MSGPERDEALERRVRAALDEAAARLPATRAARLAAARARAVEAARGRRRLRLVPAAVAAAAAAVAGVALLRPWRAAAPPPEAVEDIEILTAAEPLELIEDLDFYRWLEEEHGDGVG